MSTMNLATAVPLQPLPLPVFVPKPAHLHDGTTEAVLPIIAEPTPPTSSQPFIVPPSLRKGERTTATSSPSSGRKKFALEPGIARMFSPEECEEALVWYREHESEIPAVQRYDPNLRRWFTELQRIARCGGRYDALGERTRNRALEMYMSDADERLAPYFAFLAGAALGQIAATYGIANVRGFLDAIEEFLTQLEQRGVNRDAFLAKAERAIKIRERDAATSAARQLATPPQTVRLQEEHVPKRGKRAGTHHGAIWCASAARAPKSKHAQTPLGSAQRRFQGIAGDKAQEARPGPNPRAS